MRTTEGECDTHRKLTVVSVVVNSPRSASTSRTHASGTLVQTVRGTSFLERRRASRLSLSPAPVDLRARTPFVRAVATGRTLVRRGFLRGRSIAAVCCPPSASPTSTSSPVRDSSQNRLPLLETTRALSRMTAARTRARCRRRCRLENCPRTSARSVLGLAAATAAGCGCSESCSRIDLPASYAGASTIRFVRPVLAAAYLRAAASRASAPRGRRTQGMEGFENDDMSSTGLQKRTPAPTNLWCCSSRRSRPRSAAVR